MMRMMTQDWLEGQGSFAELWEQRGFVGAGWEPLDLEGAGPGEASPCDGTPSEPLLAVPHSPQ